MTNPITPFFRQMPNQSLGVHWHLAGSLKHLNNALHGGGELILVRRIDALSPHIQAAGTSQYVIPTVTVTTPSGTTAELYNARVHGKTATDDWEATSSNTATEEFAFTFQKIEVSYVDGKKSATDDWTL